MLDSPEDLRRKIKKAVITPRVTEDNGLLALVQYILLPAAGLKGKKEFGICKNDTTEPTMYTDIAQINEDYANDIVSEPLPAPAWARVERRNTQDFANMAVFPSLRSAPSRSRRPSPRRSSS